jgi:hypothetical protein
MGLLQTIGNNHERLYGLQMVSCTLKGSTCIVRVTQLWKAFRPTRATVATLALGSRPRQGVARLRAKKKEAREQRQRHWKGAGQEEARESSHTPGSLRKCKGVWGSEHSHSQSNSHFGRGSPGGLPKLQRASWRVKSQWIVALFISLERSWNVDV